VGVRRLREPARDGYREQAEGVAPGDVPPAAGTGQQFGQVGVHEGQLGAEADPGEQAQDEEHAEARRERGRQGQDGVAQQVDLEQGAPAEPVRQRREQERADHLAEEHRSDDQRPVEGGQ
jgi:hypothetical protein